MPSILISGNEAIYDLELKLILNEYKLTFANLNNISNLLHKHYYDILLVHGYYTEEDFNKIDLLKSLFNNPIIFISTYYKNEEIKFADVIITVPINQGTLLENIQGLLGDNDLAA